MTEQPAEQSPPVEGDGDVQQTVPENPDATNTEGGDTADEVVGPEDSEG